MDQTKILIRYNPPTKFDKYPAGTIWGAHMDDEHPCTLYIQISNDPDVMRWITVGNLLEISFRDFLEDEKFINETLRLFEYHDKKPLNIISDIIKNN